MTNVVEVVLFYSKYSKECGPCIQYIMNNKLPVILIPLDNKESRDRAFNGSLIQIKNVPSMVVSYVNNDVQLYVGSQKIIAWFSFMTKAPTGNDNKMPSPYPDSNTRIGENLDTPQKKRKAKKKKNSVKHIIPQSDPSNHTELIFGEESYIPDNNAGNTRNTHVPSQLSSKLSNNTVKTSPNEGIMAMAKQMAAERDKQTHFNSNENNG